VQTFVPGIVFPEVNLQLAASFLPGNISPLLFVNSPALKYKARRFSFSGAAQV
jgi:hypothetical protein